MGALSAPLEAAKVRLMTGRADGLKGALDAVATVDGESQPARLWDGFGPLLARELPFTSAKLAVYTAAQQTLFQLLPAARERPVASFLVTVACGALAGAVGALTSAPADAVVTELATGKYGPDWKKALATVVGGDGITATIKGAPRLFAGAAQSVIRGDHCGAAHPLRLLPRQAPGRAGRPVAVAGCVRGPAVLLHEVAEIIKMC